MHDASRIRPCAVCGLFYPEHATELRQDISRMLEEIRCASITGRISGLVAPHAGYMYSGPTAAHGYALLRGKRYSAVVIISPSHREYFDGVSVFPGDAYETPLGEVEVSGSLRDLLLRTCPVVHATTRGHGEEHAIEVQLPFLQETLGGFSILPVVIGDQRREICFQLGHALGDVLSKKDALLIASTDLSHYHPSDIANLLDEVMMNDVRAFDAEQLMNDLESGRTEACGGGPTVAMMVALRHLGVGKMEILHHCNSGDVTGDTDRVVGYLSAAAYA
jgi:hypothetical protein